MTKINMVAGGDSDSKLCEPPPFDQGNVEQWISELAMHLRKKKRNHLGLEDPPSLPQGPGITSRDSKSYKESQTAKLKQALHVKELQQLWLMQGDLTFEQIATTCKRYDEAIKDSMFTARRDIAEGK